MGFFFRETYDDNFKSEKDNYYQESSKAEQEFYARRKAIEIEHNKWYNQLKRDMRDTDYSPSINEDVYAYDFSLCFDTGTLGIAEYITSYVSKLNGNKILLLIEMEDFKALRSKQKDGVYKRINNCLEYS